MMIRTLRFLSGKRGQALIEFALVVPFLLLLMFTMVDFGIAIDRRLVLQHAVREGARYAAVHTDAVDITQLTSDQAQGIIDIGDVDICYIDQDDSNASPGDAGDAVKVSGSYTWDFPILREIFGAFGASPISIDMTPSGTARLERSVSGATACS